MKLTIHYRPCLLQEATELVHGYVNQIPVEQLAGQGPYCIPVEEIIRIRTIACEGLDPESEAMQFFFHGIHFEDKSDGLLTVARCMVYSLMEDLIPDVDTAVKMMLRVWPKYRKSARINNVSVYGMGFSGDEPESFRSLSKEIAKLPLPVSFQLQLVEAFSNYEAYLGKLMDILKPVAEKLESLLEPWVQRAQPLLRQWEEYLSTEDNVRDFFMRKTAIPELTSTELTFALHYMKSDLGLVMFADFCGPANILVGVGQSVGLLDGDTHRPVLENCDYLVLRQIANPDRVAMLLAMMDSPMTAQELAHKLDLHPGSVFRDLNSMSNSNLLLREVLGGKNTYRTNYSLLEKLFQKILQMFGTARASGGQ